MAITLPVGSTTWQYSSCLSKFCKNLQKDLAGLWGYAFQLPYRSTSSSKRASPPVATRTKYSMKPMAAPTYSYAGYYSTAYESQLSLSSRALFARPTRPPPPPLLAAAIVEAPSRPYRQSTVSGHSEGPLLLLTGLPTRFTRHLDF